MVEKPISGDEEQRRAQTKAARFQSGLPPEEDVSTRSLAERKRKRKHRPHEQQRSESEPQTDDVA